MLGKNQSDFPLILPCVNDAAIDSSVHCDKILIVFCLPVPIAVPSAVVLIPWQPHTVSED